MPTWMESDALCRSDLRKQIVSLVRRSQTRVLLRDTTHSCDHFNIPRPRFTPLHLFTLRKKMLRNLSNPFCNMLHRTTACHTICHVLLCMWIFICSNCTAQHPPTDRADQALTRQPRQRCFAWLLPLHVVQVPRYAQSADRVQLAVVHQAVVPTASHGHPGHQIPVVQKRHVAPHISHHHTWLCATCNAQKKGLLELISRAIKRSERKTNTPPSVFLCRSKNGLNLLLWCILVAAGVCGTTAVAIIGLKINDWLKPDLSGASTKWEGAEWFHHYQNHPRIHHYCHVY